MHTHTHTGKEMNASRELLPSQSYADKLTAVEGGGRRGKGGENRKKKKHKVRRGSEKKRQERRTGQK
jgi:hypothetical protein